MLENLGAYFSVKYDFAFFGCTCLENACDLNDLGDRFLPFSEVNSGFFYKSADERQKLVDAERKFTNDKVQKVIDLKRKVSCIKFYC